MSSSLFLSRRSILTAAVFAALSPLAVRSQPRSPFHRFRIGNFTATIVSDGTLKLHPPKQVLLDAPQDEITAALAAANQPTDFLRVEQNVLVLDTGNARLLFDTGSGSRKLYGDDSGQLPANLEAAGIAPNSVTGVVLTHAHFDHLWGVSTPDGQPNFPNAQIYIADTEYAYWMADARSANDTQAAGVKRHLVPLRERIVELRDRQEVVTGVQAVRTLGHTPGHTSYLISSGSDSYLLLGDAAFHAPLSLIFPTSRSLCDVDAQVGIATRKRVIEQVTSERQAIIAYHYPWPGIGRIEKSGEAHRFVPA